MVHDTIDFTNDKYVKLDKREKLQINSDTIGLLFINHTVSIIMGIVIAVFLLSFMPHFVDLISKGYNFNFAITQTLSFMHKEFFTIPYYWSDTPKSWAIIPLGAAGGIIVHTFYKTN